MILYHYKHLHHPEPEPVIDLIWESATLCGVPSFPGRIRPQSGHDAAQNMRQRGLIMVTYVQARGRSWIMTQPRIDIFGNRRKKQRAQDDITGVMASALVFVFFSDYCG